MAASSLSFLGPPTANAQLRCRGLAFAYGGRQILRDIDLSITAGDCVGVVGNNGAGKTTLLRLLAGQLTPSAGEIHVTPPSSTIGLLDQTVDAGVEETVRGYVARRTGALEVIADFEAVLVDLANDVAGATDRYDAALARYNAVASLDQSLAVGMSSVGLNGVDPERLVRSLSGGQQTRVNLVATVLSTHDVLLLDEPTNNLDLDGLDLLREFMARRDRPIAVVSHDRDLLDRTVTAVFEIDDHSHGGTRSNGGFAAWMHEREVARARHEQDFAEYTERRTELQTQVDRQKRWSATGARRARRDLSERDRTIRAWRAETAENLAGRAKQTAKKLERLDRDEAVEKPFEGWELRLGFGEAERSGDDVVRCRAATVVRGSFRLGPVDVLLRAGDRVLLTGVNGSGKTTLIDLLLGTLQPTTGSVDRGRSVRASTLEQSRERFDEHASLIEGFVDISGEEPSAARSQLAKLGLAAERVARPAAELSPGELTRASLGLFAITNSNLLVLDEPTNHLDLPAIEQLESALDVFPHTVILVSHDQRLIDGFRATCRWHLTDGDLTT
ncbi:MAG: ABC-F family ATP-binding cassette domain-containing protein [Acidimicrobiales bacterium]